MEDNRRRGQTQSDLLPDDRQDGQDESAYAFYRPASGFRKVLRQGDARRRHDNFGGEQDRFRRTRQEQLVKKQLNNSPVQQAGENTERWLSG